MMYDSDLDGQLTKEELRQAFPITKQSTFDAFFKKSDLDSSGGISFDEYLDQAIELDDRKVKNIKMEYEHMKKMRKIQQRKEEEAKKL